MNDVVLYTKDYCPFCAHAKALLMSKGVTFTEYEITGDDAKTLEMTERSGGRKTVPQIFIAGNHIGGSDELAALNASGELNRLLSGQTVA